MTRKFILVNVDNDDLVYPEQTYVNADKIVSVRDQQWGRANSLISMDGGPDLRVLERAEEVFALLGFVRQQ